MRIITCCAVLAGVMCASEVLAVHAIDTQDIRKMTDLSIDLSVQGGMLNGESHEFVYEPSENDRTISELIWDLKSIPMGGAVVSVKLAEKVRFNGGAWIGLSEGSGEMEDYDWQVEGLEWTDYSRSDVDVISSYIFDLNLSIELMRAGDVSLDVLAGLKSSSFEWEDHGGEYIYSVDGFRDTVGNFEEGEVGITYEQMFVVPYAGLMMAYHAGSFDFGGYLTGSVFGIAEDKDHHVLRGLHFEEEFEAVPYIGAGLTAVWRMSERWYLDVSCEYENIPETTGDMYVEELDASAEDAAGISHESLMVKAALGVRL